MYLIYFFRINFIQMKLLLILLTLKSIRSEILSKPINNDVKIAGRDHKVHDLILNPDQHSWCELKKIRQIVTDVNCVSQEIENYVCVGTCFSYSVPQTMPELPGDELLDYCDSCQPSQSLWNEVILHCEEDGAIYKTTKFIQIIKNCSCAPCRPVPVRKSNSHESNSVMQEHSISDLIYPSLLPDTYPYNIGENKMRSGKEEERDKELDEIANKAEKTEGTGETFEVNRMSDKIQKKVDKEHNVKGSINKKLNTEKESKVEGIVSQYNQDLPDRESEKRVKVLDVQHPLHKNNLALDDENAELSFKLLDSANNDIKLLKDESQALELPPENSLIPDEVKALNPSIDNPESLNELKENIQPRSKEAVKVDLKSEIHKKNKLYFKNPKLSLDDFKSLESPKPEDAKINSVLDEKYPKLPVGNSPKAESVISNSVLDEKYSKMSLGDLKNEMYVNPKLEKMLIGKLLMKDEDSFKFHEDEM